MSDAQTSLREGQTSLRFGQTSISSRAKVVGHPEWVANANRYMPAATGIHWSQGGTYTYATGLNYQCSKLFFGSPDYPTNHFIVPYLGFGLTSGGNSPQETVNPNDPILIDEAFFIHPDGNEYPILFSGSAGATVTHVTGMVFGLVTLPADLPAWSIFGIRTVWHGTVGKTYIGGYKAQRHRGEKYWGAGSLVDIRALAAANGPSTAAFDPDSKYNVVGGVGTEQPVAYGPAQIFAKGWDGRPVALVTSDSLLERQEVTASADERRNMGIGHRWLDQRDSRHGAIPHIAMGIPGSASYRELTTSATKRWDFIDVIKNTYNGGLNPWTFVLDQSGRNDNTTPASAWLGRKTGLVDRIRARYGAGTRVVGMTLLPTYTSTDNSRTVAGYSADATWNPATGVLKTVNDGIKASATYNAVIDLLAAFVAASDPTKAPAAEMFPLGNVIGHPGNQDGVTNWDTIRLPSSVPLGAQIMAEYQPSLWSTRTLIGRTDLGDGTANYKVQEVYATIYQDNATILGKAMNTDTSNHVHPALHGVLWTVSRLAQSNKSKFYPVA